ncbi:hypothetical protein BKA93DRAFT_788947 [Sparassis latifolia]
MWMSLSAPSYGQDIRRGSSSVRGSWYISQASEEIDLPTILGTQDGIATLARFIDASGAFTKTGEYY